MTHSPHPVILWITLGPCGHLRASAGLAEALGGSIRRPVGQTLLGVSTASNPAEAPTEAQNLGPAGPPDCDVASGGSAPLQKWERPPYSLIICSAQGLSQQSQGWPSSLSKQEGSLSPSPR